MSNLVGVDQAMNLPTRFNPTGDVTLTADTEILIVTTTTAIVPLTNGLYAPRVRGSLAFLMGATAATALVVAFRFNGGADISTYTVAPALLANNATIQIPFELIGANSLSDWSGAGKIIEITAKASTTAATLKQVGSYSFIDLIRGPNA